MLYAGDCICCTKRRDMASNSAASACSGGRPSVMGFECGVQAPLLVQRRSLVASPTASPTAPTAPPTADVSVPSSRPPSLPAWEAGSSCARAPPDSEEPVAPALTLPAACTGRSASPSEPPWWDPEWVRGTLAPPGQPRGRNGTGSRGATPAGSHQSVELGRPVHLELAEEGAEQRVSFADLARVRDALVLWLVQLLHHDGRWRVDVLLEEAHHSRRRLPCRPAEERKHGLGAAGHVQSEGGRRGRRAAVAQPAAACSFRCAASRAKPLRRATARSADSSATERASESTGSSGFSCEGALMPTAPPTGATSGAAGMAARCASSDIQPPMPPSPGVDSDGGRAGISGSACSSAIPSRVVSALRVTSLMASMEGAWLNSERVCRSAPTWEAWRDCSMCSLASATDGSGGSCGIGASDSQCRGPRHSKCRNGRRAWRAHHSRERETLKARSSRDSSHQSRSPRHARAASAHRSCSMARFACCAPLGVPGSSGPALPVFSGAALDAAGPGAGAGAMLGSNLAAYDAGGPAAGTVPGGGRDASGDNAGRAGSASAQRVPQDLQRTPRRPRVPAVQRRVRGHARRDCRVGQLFPIAGRARCSFALLFACGPALQHRADSIRGVREVLVGERMQACMTQEAWRVPHRQLHHPGVRGCWHLPQKRRAEVRLADAGGRDGMSRVTVLEACRVASIAFASQRGLNPFEVPNPDA
eukprot:scaffold3076_cov117-Isochrysis_galbana.AAC.9